METYNEWLAHHGILGMKWGKRNGPPYPLDPEVHMDVVKKAKLDSYQKYVNSHPWSTRKQKRAKTSTEISFSGKKVDDAVKDLREQKDRLDSISSEYRNLVNQVCKELSDHPEKEVDPNGDRYKSIFDFLDYQYMVAGDKTLDSLNLNAESEAALYQFVFKDNRVQKLGEEFDKVVDDYNKSVNEYGKRLVESIADKKLSDLGLAGKDGKVWLKENMPSDPTVPIEFQYDASRYNTSEVLADYLRIKTGSPYGSYHKTGVFNSESVVEKSAFKIMDKYEDHFNNKTKQKLDEKHVSKLNTAEKIKGVSPLTYLIDQAGKYNKKSFDQELADLVLMEYEDVTGKTISDSEWSKIIDEYKKS